MVPMPVAAVKVNQGKFWLSRSFSPSIPPYDSFNVLRVHATISQYLSDIFLHLHAPPCILDTLHDVSRTVLPVFPYSEIEKDFAACGGVFNEEGEGGTPKLVKTFVFRNHEHREWQTTEAGRGVDDANIDCEARGGDVQLRRRLSGGRHCA